MKKIVFIVIVILSCSAWAGQGYKVQFSDNKFEDERNNIKKLHSQDLEDIKKMGQDPTKDYKILIDKYDITGDGAKDIIVFFNGSYYCGSHGCLTQIYSGSDLRLLLNVNTYQDITILTKKHQGLMDLKLGTSEKSVVWQWNGKKYQPSN